jgi:hypothetical protein
LGFPEQCLKILRQSENATNRAGLNIELPQLAQ